MKNPTGARQYLLAPGQVLVPLVVGLLISATPFGKSANAFTCQRDGGLAQCTEPEFASANQAHPSDAEGFQYSYGSCPAYGPWTAVWCTSAGGDWENGECNNLGAPHYALKGTWDEGAADAHIQAFAGQIWGDDVSGTSTTGWGYSGSDCGIVVGTAYQNGEVIAESKKITVSTETSGDRIFIMSRTRAVRCPEDQFSTIAANGDYLCYLPQSEGGNCGTGNAGSLVEGNPVSLLNGCKMHFEVDYASGGENPLMFARSYTSNGYIRPKGFSIEKPKLSDHWRHNYQKELHIISDSGHLTGIRRDDSEKLRSYDENGNEILNHDGSGSKLVEQPSGDWWLTLADGTKEVYDSSGRLLSIEERSGQTMSLTYVNDKLSQVTDSFGKSLTFTYDTDGQLTRVTDPSGGDFDYGYDEFGRLVSVTYPDLKTKTYLYEDNRGMHWLTGIVDEKGVQFSNYEYSVQGTVALSEHAGGANRHVFMGDKRPNYILTSVTDPLGLTVLYRMEEINGVWRLVSSDIGCATCTLPSLQLFDANGNAWQKREHGIYLTMYTFDLQTNLEVSRTEGVRKFPPYIQPESRQIDTTWDTNLRLPDVITEPDRTLDHDYDAAGNLTQLTVTDPALGSSRVTSMTYNTLGQVLTIDGPRTGVSDVTTYTYYTCSTGAECGQIHTVTNAAGHVTTFNTYDASARPLQITHPSGLIQQLTYDARGNLLTNDSGGEITTYEYDAAAQLIKVTAPDSTFYSFVYDDAHRLVEMGNQNGERIEYTLDPAGNRTEERTYDSSGVLVGKLNRTFNTQGYLTETIGAADQKWTYTYDADGYILTATDPDGRTTEMTYDAHHRLIREVDPLLAEVLYTYDTADRVTSVTDPRSLVTTYDYNGWGDLEVETSPDAGVKTFDYDPSGNPVASVDARGIPASSVFDPINRITATNYPSESVTYAYDQGTGQQGQLTTMTDTSGQTAWTYDQHGRVTQKTQTIGTQALTVSYGYDVFGRLASQTMPSGKVIDYLYTSGRVTEIRVDGQPVISNIQYRPFGPATSWTYANGTTMNRTFDLDGRITSISGPLSMNITWDDADRVAAISRPGQPGLDREYQYDDAGRLTKVTAPMTGPAPALSLSTSTAAPGDSFTVTLDNTPLTSDSWIALSRVGDPYSAYVAWTQVDPAQNPFVWNVTAPDFDGNYEARLFVRGEFTKVADAGPLSVTPPPSSGQPTLRVSARFGSPGDPLTVRMTEGPAGNNDFLIISDVGALPQFYYRHQSLYGVANFDWNTDFPDVIGDVEAEFYLHGSDSNLGARSDTMSISWEPPVAPSSHIVLYEYDPVGNRLSENDGTGVTTYGYDSSSNRLLTATGATSFTRLYDTAGNTLNDGSNTFDYCERGRLTAVNGGAVDYSHDGLGQRVSKTALSASLFVYDETGQLIGEYDSAGNALSEHVHFGAMPIALLRSSTVYYVNADHLGTPRSITDSTGTLVWRWESDPFGVAAADEDPDGDLATLNYNLRFPGQYFDAENGRQYNYFRTYDPSTGRYLESDPIGLEGGLNTYLYANASPVLNTDPTGEQAAPGLRGYYRYAVERHAATKTRELGESCEIRCFVFPEGVDIALLATDFGIKKLAGAAAQVVSRRVLTPIGIALTFACYEECRIDARGRCEQ